MQSEDSLLALYYPETNEIAEILMQGKSCATVEQPLDSEDVISLKSTDFASPEDFKAAIQRCDQPVLCCIHQNEVQDTIGWLKDSDEIAIIGEPSSLTMWRLSRLAVASKRKLDPLTKVYRRNVLTKYLSNSCQNVSLQQAVSLILLDIDHFKSINDRYGSKNSNLLLEQLGNLIRTLCRGTLVARTRGGEFGILVGADEMISKRVSQVIKKSINGNNWCIPEKVSVSFGVASVFEGSTASEILTRADEALFAAKANGRNKVVGYSEIAIVSNRVNEDLDVICMENKARVLSERVTSFVTQRSKRILETLRHEANTDGLTKLFNRRYLDKRLEEDFQHAFANQEDLCVALIDLDHFGEVNKNHGWPTGDKVLQMVANTITSNIRVSDWVGRYGGEEICIVMPGTDLRCAQLACDRIRVAIDEASFSSTNGERVDLTLSVGVAQLAADIDHSASHLIERVSQYTLAAKQLGRNQVFAGD